MRDKVSLLSKMHRRVDRGASKHRCPKNSCGQFTRLTGLGIRGTEFIGTPAMNLSPNGERILDGKREHCRSNSKPRRGDGLSLLRGFTGDTRRYIHLHTYPWVFCTEAEIHPAATDRRRCAGIRARARTKNDRGRVVRIGHRLAAFRIDTSTLTRSSDSVRIVVSPPCVISNSRRILTRELMMRV